MEALLHFGGSTNVVSRLNTLLREKIALPEHKKMADFWRGQVESSWFNGQDIGYGQLKFLLRYFRFSPAEILGDITEKIDNAIWKERMKTSPMVVVGTAGTGDSKRVGISNIDDYVKLRAISELEWLAEN